MTLRFNLAVLVCLVLQSITFGREPRIIKPPYEPGTDSSWYIVYPGPEYNVLCIDYAQYCLGNNKSHSCDFSMAGYNEVLAHYEVEGVNRVGINVENHIQYGFVGNPMDPINRIWFKENMIHQCFRFETTDTIVFDDSLKLKGTMFDNFYGVSIEIVNWDYSRSVDTLDLRERIYVKLVAQDSTGVPPLARIVLLLKSNTTADFIYMDLHPIPHLEFEVISDIHIYVTDSIDIKIPMNMCSEESLEEWTEASDSTDGQIRTLYAIFATNTEDTSYVIADSAAVYHNLVMVEGEDSTVRGTPEDYRVRMYPGKIAYDMALYHWRFEPTNSALNTVYRYYNENFMEDEPMIPMRRKPEPLYEASIWGGEMVTEGTIHSMLYFENDPRMTLNDSIVHLLDSTIIFDDIPVYVSGWNSTDSLQIGIIDRDWQFDEDSDVDEFFLRRGHRLPKCKIERFPEEGDDYIFSNLVDFKLVKAIPDTCEDPDCCQAFENPLSISSLKIITEGPDSGYVYLMQKPFVYEFARFIHPDVLTPSNWDSHPNLSPEFKVRQGDQPWTQEINFEQLSIELNNTVFLSNDSSFKSLAIDELENLADSLHINVVAEPFVLNYLEKGQGRPAYNFAFYDSLSSFLKNVVDSSAALVKGLDLNGLRAPLHNAQWPLPATGKYGNEVSFIRGDRVIYYLNYWDEATISPLDTIYLKYLPDSARNFGEDGVRAYFELRSDLDVIYSDTLGWDYSRADSAVYFWKRDNIFATFDTTEMVINTIIADTALLIGTVLDHNDVPLEDDTIRVGISGNLKVDFADGFDGSYTELSIQARFWFGWDSAWVVVEDAVPGFEPTVQWVYSLAEQNWGDVDLAYDAPTLTWRGSIYVRDTLDTYGVAEGARFHVQASVQNYSGMDSLDVFAQTVELAPWWWFEGWQPRTNSDSLTFSANWDYYQPNAYCRDNLLLRLRPVNYPLDWNKNDFGSPIQVSSTILQGGQPLSTGAPTWVNIDSTTGYPLGLIGYDGSDLLFITQEWSNLSTPSIGTGRTLPLSYAVQFKYSTLSGWGGFIDTIRIQTDTLVQDPYDMLRQEYFDFFDDTAKVDHRFIRIISYDDPKVSVGGEIDGMPPKGFHHHYRNVLATQNLPTDTTQEIWWNRTIGDILVPMIRNFDFGFGDRPVQIYFTSGFRCPVRNLNPQVRGAPGSAHLNGEAVDFNLFPAGLSDTTDSGQKEISRGFYKFYSEFRYHPKRMPILYGSPFNEQNSRYTLDKTRFILPSGQRSQDYPDPGKVWPLMYDHPYEGTIRIYYRRAHADTYTKP